MARTKRRTVSMRGPLYWALHRACGREGKAMAAVVDEQVTQWLEQRGHPTQADPPPEGEPNLAEKQRRASIRRAHRGKPTVEEERQEHFTA